MPLRHSRHGNLFTCCATASFVTLKSTCWFSCLPVASSKLTTEGALLIGSIALVSTLATSGAASVQRIQECWPTSSATFCPSPSSPNGARYFFVPANKISWILSTLFFSLTSLAAQKDSAAATSRLPKRSIRDCGVMSFTMFLQCTWKNRSKSSNFCKCGHEKLPHAASGLGQKPLDGLLRYALFTTAILDQHACSHILLGTANAEKRNCLFVASTKIPVHSSK